MEAEALITDLDILVDLVDVHNKTCKAPLLVYIYPADPKLNVLKCSFAHEFLVHPEVCGKWMDQRWGIG